MFILASWQSSAFVVVCDILITLIISLCTPLVCNTFLKPQFRMGKVRRKHNWKGRQQSDTQQPSDKEKTDVVVELQGRNTNCESKNCLIEMIWHYSTL